VVRQISRNITAMADMAQGRGIKVILCTIPPVGRNQAATLRDPATIADVNNWLRHFAKVRGYPFVDYTAVLAAPDGSLDIRLSEDGLHPNSVGHKLMWPRLEAALKQAGLIGG